MAVTVTDSRRHAADGSTISSDKTIPVTFVTLAGGMLYALVALGLRFVMARALFLFGQPMIDGPTIPLAWRSFEFSFVLPVDVKAATVQLFQTQYAALPMPPEVAAYVFAYGLFALPICLILGFAARLAALALLALTVLLAVYMTPEALWTTHVYWGAILAVLLSVGPGAISLDAVIRYLNRA
jgi:putative oxidoreductase